MGENDKSSGFRFFLHSNAAIAVISEKEGISGWHDEGFSLVK